MGPAVASAVVPLGLEPAYLPDFIGNLALGNIPAVLRIPGVTPQMLGAGFTAYQKAWAESVRYGWYSLIPIVAIGAISCALLGPVKEDMDSQVDAPVDKAPVQTV